MTERLRVWLADGHQCDLDLGDGSAQELMQTIENAGDRSWFSTDDGRSRVRASGEALERAYRESHARDFFLRGGGESVGGLHSVVTQLY
jgi:hypothetical protein